MVLFNGKGKLPLLILVSPLAEMRKLLILRSNIPTHQAYNESFMLIHTFSTSSTY